MKTLDAHPVPLSSCPVPHPLAPRSFLLVAMIALAIPPGWLRAAPDPAGYAELSPARINEIEEFLPAQPSGFGKPIEDRAYWSDPAVISRTTKAAGKADKLLSQEFPAWDDDAYLEYSRVGTRPRGEKMENQRSSWLEPLVLAECLENKGRFPPLLNKVLDAYAAEPTWTMPGHDSKLKCFHREEYDVDLRTATFGNELAEALYLLGDKVDPGVRQRLEAALRQRLLDPFTRRLLTNKGCWWLGSAKDPIKNNWNAVCLSGVVGAALTLIPDKAQRAAYVAAGEHYSTYYINSFQDDGYCAEGVGYWNYGFGNFALLREEIVEATGGHVDLFANPKIAAIALYGVRIRIGGKAIPPFGDCRFGTTPDPRLLAYCNDVMGLGLTFEKFTALAGAPLVDALQVATPFTGGAGNAPLREDPLRFYFDKAGVLACRPAPQTDCQLGVAIKSDGNGSHSHNDVGSYAIAIGDDEPTGDPGGPKTYDNKTFGPERYTYKILNSYGHPVPVIAGKLQIDATKAKPVVLSTAFTKDRDEIKIDMAPAYNVPALKQLTRTMDYSRAGTGEVDMIDDVSYSSPSTFEDALITHGDWKQVDPKTVLLTLGQAKLWLTIEAPGGFTLKPEKIEELATPAFTRLGVVLSQPVQTARVRMVFHPAP